MPKQTKIESFVRPVQEIQAGTYRPASVPQNTTTADLLKFVGGQAIEALQGYEDAKLLGPDVLPEEAGELPKGIVSGQRLSMGEAVQLNPPDELNLRRIENMRRQNIISADAAKVLAAKAVAAASARLPGRAAQFRQQAAAFFGDFGEGQDLLQATSEETERNKLDDLARKNAINDGFFVLDESGQAQVPNTMLNAHRDYAFSSKTRDFRKAEIEQHFIEGKLVASQLDTYGNLLGEDISSKVFAQLGGLMSSGKIIEASQLELMLDNELSMGRNKLLALRKQAEQTPGAPRMDATSWNQITKNLEDSVSNVRAAIKTQDWATLMKTRSQGMVDMLKLHGTAVMPVFTMLSSIEPGAGVKYMELMNHLYRLPEAQRRQLLNTDPQSAIMYNMTTAMQDQSKGMQNLVRGWLPSPFNRGEYAATLLGAGAVLTDPKSGKEYPSLTDKAAKTAIDALRKNDEQIGAILANPNVKHNLTPQNVKSLQGVISNRIYNAISSLASAFAMGDTGSDPDIVYNKESRRFEVVVPEMEESFFPGEDSDWAATAMHGQTQVSIDRLNDTLRIMETYQDAPEFQTWLKGKPAVDFLSDIIIKTKRGGIGARKKATESKQTVQDTENLPTGNEE